MSALRIAARAAPDDWVPAAALIAGLGLLLVGGNLAGNGVFATASGSTWLAGWETGSMLRVLALWVASWLGAILPQDTALTLLYVLLAAMGAAGVFQQLRKSDWPGWQAALALLLLLAHPMLLQSVTLATPEFLSLIAVALLVPARRRLEAVGDVQSILSYGLLLPLLLLAGPPLAALIPVLMLAVPLSEREARGNVGIFLAMLIVAVIPVVIVVLGIWSMTARLGIGANILLAPFVEAYRPGGAPYIQPLMLLLTSAPIGLVVIAHMIIPDRRRKLMTSLLVLALPLWLVVGNSLFSFSLPPWQPAMILLGTSIGWLCATRIRPGTRVLALGLLAAGVAASWALAPVWSDPSWLEGLLPIRLFGLSLG